MLIISLLFYGLLFFYFKYWFVCLFAWFAFLSLLVVGEEREEGGGETRWRCCVRSSPSGVATTGPQWRDKWHPYLFISKSHGARSSLIRREWLNKTAADTSKVRNTGVCRRAALFSARNTLKDRRWGRVNHRFSGLYVAEAYNSFQPHHVE